ncbi:hypothetical protein Hdeb2414_s0034g00726641 [Helianthus debilis subsp. tardiflorus]
MVIRFRFDFKSNGSAHSQVRVMKSTRQQGFGSGSVDSVNSPSQLSQLGQLRPGQLSPRFDARDLEYCRMHASKSSLGNDITKSYIALHRNIQVAFQNYGTVGIGEP